MRLLLGELLPGLYSCAMFQIEAGGRDFSPEERLKFEALIFDTTH